MTITDERIVRAKSHTPLPLHGGGWFFGPERYFTKEQWAASMKRIRDSQNAYYGAEISEPGRYAIEAVLPRTRYEVAWLMCAHPEVYDRYQRKRVR